MDIRISTDPAEIDFALVHRFLSEESYWCPGIPAAVVRRAIEHSLCFSALAADGRQLGFARVVSDHATFAYLCDVFVVAEARGQGIGKQLMAAVLAHPELQHLRRFMLATADAHALYAEYGFTALDKPERFMQRYDPRAYQFIRDE
jgi:GNAT superfamily N-acetyltransferase